MTIALTGVTGYVGGRLRQCFEAKGLALRCLVRSPISVPDDVPQSTRYVVGDASDRHALMSLLEGVDTAYYFIHSMGGECAFEQQDRRLALLFAQVASRCRVRRLIYLGGLGSSYEELSAHLKSRQEVGQVLRANADGVQVLELRASIIIGSCSLSFEMIRSLVDRLPIMLTPRWVYTLTQPIAIEDLLLCLDQARTINIEGNQILELGGKERVSYADLMGEYARQIGVKRLMIPVPFLTPKLSGLWLGLVTPIYARVGRKLVESAQCSTVVHDPLAGHLFHLNPLSIQEAIARALAYEEHNTPLSRWNDAVSASFSHKLWNEGQLGARLVDHQERFVPCSPEKAFIPIEQFGGKNGHYFAEILWWLRGFIDLCVGGVGMRRGRRDNQQLHPGDVVRFWRVEEIRPPHLLRLVAEMRLPGQAWLEFRVEAVEGGSVIVQRAFFDPAGVLGLAYWYLLYPLHHLVFWGVLRNIAKIALQEEPSIYKMGGLKFKG